MWDVSREPLAGGGSRVVSSFERELDLGLTVLHPLPFWSCGGFRCILSMMISSAMDVAKTCLVQPRGDITRTLFSSTGQ